jgi:MFS transporter, FHS family, L-fucose permease
MSQTTNNSSKSSLYTLISVFFFWGFVAASNDILIPVFKKAFSLSQGESQLVSVAFYVAYTVGSLLYMGISKLIGHDILNKIGYKNGLALGLFISALGTLLFYPAANTGSFVLMLSGLFIVGIGFSLQQIVANPLAISMGSPSTGSQRLTMAGGINNFGTTIGPLIVSFAIFGSVASNTEASIESVKIPYLVLGVVFIIVAVVLKASNIPNHIEQELHTDIADDSEGSAMSVRHDRYLFICRCGSIYGQQLAGLYGKRFGFYDERHCAIHFPILGKFDDWSLDRCCGSFRHFCRKAKNC